MARKLIVAGNWKLNGDVDLAQSMLPKINKAIENSPDINCIIYPSFVHLQPLAELSSNYKNIDIGAQNMSLYTQGAFTGEVSWSMLKSVGIKHVLLGHSERRSVFCETDEQIFSKTCLAIEHGFNVTFCVGETLEQREVGRTMDVVAKQLNKILSVPAMLQHITIAYEPVWAIGTGQTASPEQAQDVHRFIRQEIANIDNEAAERMHILYGGSVNSANARQLFAQADIDGGLVGGASLKIEDFLGVISCTR